MEDETCRTPENPEAYAKGSPICRRGWCKMGLSSPRTINWFRQPVRSTPKVIGVVVYAMWKQLSPNPLRLTFWNATFFGCPERSRKLIKRERETHGEWVLFRAIDRLRMYLELIANLRQINKWPSWYKTISCVLLVRLVEATKFGFNTVWSV